MLTLKKVNQKSSWITGRVYLTQANPFECHQSLEGLKHSFLPMMPREKHSELSLIFCLERRNHRVKSSITRKTLNPRYCQKQKKRNIRHILLNEGINHSLTIFLFLNYYQAKLFVLSAKTKVIKPGLFTDCSTDL